VTTKERFEQVMNFRRIDRTLKWEWAYWIETLYRWNQEGLPLSDEESQDLVKFKESEILIGEAYFSAQNEPREKDVHDYFTLDPRIVRVPVNLFLCPPFERQILAQEDDIILIRDINGAHKKVFRNRIAMPQFVKRAVENRDDFEQIKERFDPMDERRFPVNWDSLIKEYKHRDFPLALGEFRCGFFGILNELIGIENLSYLLHDEPQLIKDMVNFFADFYITLFSKVLSQIEVDFVHFWEDMAFKTGPLISPAVFRELILPSYKMTISALKEFGVKMFLVDSDGNLWNTIPLLLEAGVTGIYPLEVAAGMDVVKLRKVFPKLQLIGGIDKRSIAQGKREIDEELSRVATIIDKGGYIPCIDHSVTRDISWDNFCYYRRRLNQLIEELSMR